MTANSETIAYHRRFYEKNLTTGEVTKYYFFGGKLVAQKKGSENLVYFHQDHLTGTSVMSDSTGASQGTVKYFPFGGTRSTSGTIPTDKKFTGQRLDGTGLYFVVTQLVLDRYLLLFDQPLRVKLGGCAHA